MTPFLLGKNDPDALAVLVWRTSHLCAQASALGPGLPATRVFHEETAGRKK
jgi:hypothetical protein